MIEIRAAVEADWEQIWPIFRAVVQRGDAFVYAPDTSESEARAIWMARDHSVYIALLDGQVAGSYWFRRNQPGLGDHVANAAYMVHPGFGGRGVGRAMGRHSLCETWTAGFSAMQFNIVVSVNEPAVRLWTSLGFEVIGRIPGGFRHAQFGMVDALIMYKSLDDDS